MKKKYMPKLIKELTKRSYNFVNNIDESFGFISDKEVEYKDTHNINYNKQNELIINITINVNYYISDNKYTNTFKFTYTMDKSSQIKYTCIKNNKNIDNFINSIPKTYDVSYI